MTMELVMRVRVQAEDDDIVAWAKRDDTDFEGMVDILKEEARDFCEMAHLYISTTFEFIEWEE